MNTHSQQRGYTLLELIVSLGIFSVVMLVVTGAYLTLIDLDRQARANNQVAASLSFAVESMARSLRTGKSYDQGPGSAACAGGSSSITFTNSEGEEIQYRKKSDGTIGQCTGSGCLDARAAPLTDPQIMIDTLCFYVRGETASDNYQPHVTFTITGTMMTGPEEDQRSTFAIQGAATQREIDL